MFINFSPIRYFSLNIFYEISGYIDLFNCSYCPMQYKTISRPQVKDRSEEIFLFICVFNYFKFDKLSEIILKKVQNALRTFWNN